MAIYTYYDDPKTFERIKDGNFTYNLILQNEIGGSFVEVIGGVYKRNLRNGQWKHVLKYKDFVREGQFTGTSLDNYKSIPNETETGTIELVTNYRNGVPNGKWTYSNKLSKRGMSFNYARQKVFTPYYKATDIKIEMNFKNGTCVGKFIYNDMYGKKITGQFDSTGMLDGTWTYNTTSTVGLEKYVHGKLLQKVVRTTAGEIVEKGEFKVEDDTKASNIFQSKVVDLMATIYNDKDFFYSKIGGDVSIKVSNYGELGIDIMGGKFYYPDPNSQKKKISDGKERYVPSELMDFCDNSECLIQQFKKTMSKSEHSICNNCNGGVKVVFSDINSDGKMDAIVHYITIPTEQETDNYGQSAMYENDRIAIYLSSTMGYKLLVDKDISGIIAYSIKEDVDILSAQGNTITFEKICEDGSKKTFKAVVKGSVLTLN
ncbi:MAG: hypothetical protein BGO69_15180 [Bacteroidetes bacterium 46-16]|nr:MAG: hypothetical protein BGO69_15180 [Bacteroidetes bacterium 46-16]